VFDDAFLARLELLQVIARRLFRGRQRAERKTRKVGSGLEFADHREYSPGDDIRNLDWNVLMRLGQSLIRLYEEDEDLPIRIAVDVSESMQTSGGGKLRYAQQIAAALAYVGLANLDRVGLTCMSRKVHSSLPAVRGKGRIFRVFEFLRAAQRGGPTDLRAACSRLAAESVQPGLTVVLSDFYDMDGAFDGLNLLRFRKHEPVASRSSTPSRSTPTQRPARRRQPRRLRGRRPARRDPQPRHPARLRRGPREVLRRPRQQLPRPRHPLLPRRDRRPLRRARPPHVPPRRPLRWPRTQGALR
jgi:uncharacterized protein (DUF58 family)